LIQVNPSADVKCEARFLTNQISTRADRERGECQSTPKAFNVRAYREMPRCLVTIFQKNRHEITP
jgi:hypothetical protein